MEMDYYFLSQSIGMIWEYFLVFYHSTFFGVVKFLLGIYVVVLFIDIILLLILRGVGADLKKTLYGMDAIPTSKNKLAVRWNKIKSRLDSESSSQYKAAILEADKFVDEILGKIGYEGKNMKEKLQQATPGQIENINELQNAHKIRNRIVFEKDFNINKEEAKDIIETFETFLRNMEAV